MKKIITAAACGLLVGGIASADFDIKPYVGAGIGFAKHSYGSEYKSALTASTKLKSNVLLGNFMFGLQFHENAAVEAGYTFFNKAKVTLTGNTNTDHIKVRDITLKLVGNHNIDNCFDLLGSVGLGQLKAKYTGTNFLGTTVGVDSSKVGFRLGAGGQYKFDDHFAMRGMINYRQGGMKDKSANKNKVLKSNMSLDLGLTYIF